MLVVYFFGVMMKKEKKAFMDKIKDADNKFSEMIGFAEELFGTNYAYTWVLNNCIKLLKEAHKQKALQNFQVEGIVELADQLKGSKNAKD